MQFLGILIFTISTHAHAFVEASCKAGGCLKYGWTNVGPGVSHDISCKKDDCAGLGWTFRNNINGYESLILCDGGGCFITGFSEYDKTSGKKLSTLTCGTDKAGASDCMKFGWVVDDGQGHSNVSRCKWGDCEAFGWVTQGPGWSSVVDCKRGSCFQEGWIVR